MNQNEQPAENPLAWPTDEGIWMGYHPELGWFPFETMELKDDLPTAEQLKYEREHPNEKPDRKTLAILARWPESSTSWPYTFQSCHPVKMWRKPSDEEMAKARHFYQKDVQPERPPLTSPPPPI